MHIWQPELGETLLARTPVSFATGEAMPVSGMRWFRDTERNDIQNELPGWPEGPIYTARSAGNSLARNIGKGGVLALGAVIMGVLTGGGGSGPSSAKAGTERPTDRADEVEDFPVMWAAPGTIARTLPWQLDPARAPDKEHYRTHAIVTDRRIVIVGLPVLKKDRKVIEDEVLWQIPRSAISKVEPRNFHQESDVKILFTDGSWCRLRALSRPELTRHLIRPPELIPLGSLSPEQLSTVDDFLMSAQTEAPDAGPPIITRRSCGHYRVEILPLSRYDSFFGASELEIIMDSSGVEVEVTAQHPDDF
ncbi:hypothetical protein AB0N81_33875 [Streptomyces sp. NPDC093510]|uniref:hypothetical protein n=1 Tax=Streptomyces sp. NPDC093510 TaxID=3155199 RepID=UPI00343D411A